MQPDLGRRSQPHLRFQRENGFPVSATVYALKYLHMACGGKCQQPELSSCQFWKPTGPCQGERLQKRQDKRGKWRG